MADSDCAEREVESRTKKSPKRRERDTEKVKVFGEGFSPLVVRGPVGLGGKAEVIVTCPVNSATIVDCSHWYILPGAASQIGLGLYWTRLDCEKFQLLQTPAVGTEQA